MDSGAVVGLMIPVVFVVGFIMLVKGNKDYGIRKMREMLDGRRYEDYRQNHPDCVGRYTSCCNCGGSRIWSKKLASSADGSISEHCCRDCGEQLFFSVTGKMLKKMLHEDKNENETNDSKHTDIAVL